MGQTYRAWIEIWTPPEDRWRRIAVLHPPFSNKVGLAQMAWMFSGTGFRDILPVCDHRGDAAGRPDMDWPAEDPMVTATWAGRDDLLDAITRMMGLLNADEFAFWRGVQAMVATIDAMTYGGGGPAVARLCIGTTD